MIFVTVGTELPFDRLVRTVDAWARETGRSDVFAQIGESAYRPGFIRYAEYLDAAECLRHFTDSELVISHAGMGTILTALSRGQRLLVMPRRASLGEHRNEHQLATARYLHGQGRIEVAFDEHELRQRLNALEQLQPKARISQTASPELIDALRDFIHGVPSTEVEARARSARTERMKRPVALQPTESGGR